MRQRKTQSVIKDEPSPKTKVDDNNIIGKTVVLIQWLIHVLLAVCLVGFLTNKAILLYEKSYVPTLGSIVQLDQHKVNLWCEGQGKDTVFFLPAGGHSFLQAHSLIKNMSKFARVCSFDRSGIAYSDNTPVNADKHDVDFVIKEMEHVLSTSNEKGPFVLVGHQFGGSIAAAYTIKHPENVKGLILMNSATPVCSPNECLELLDSFHPALHTGEVFSIIGLMRFLTTFHIATEQFGFQLISEVEPQLKYFINQQRTYSTASHELETLQNKFNDYLIKSVHNQTEWKPLSLPVELIYSDHFLQVPSPHSANKVWDSLKSKESVLNNLSDRVSIEYITNSTLFFPLVKSEQTSKLVEEFLQSINK